MAVARQNPAAVGRRSGPARGKKAGPKGATKLSKAASQSLQKNSAVIARALLQNALKGNVASMRYLFELAQGSQDEMAVGKARLTRSVANELAAEPQWHEESMEATAETAT